MADWRSVLGYWYRLARGVEDDRRASLYSLPDIDAYLNMYRFSQDAARVESARLVAYHSFGIRDCLVVVGEGEAGDRALWLSLLLSVLRLDYCGAWLGASILDGWEPSIVERLSKALGPVIVLVDSPSDTGVAKYRAGRGVGVVDSWTLLGSAADALKDFLSKAELGYGVLGLDLEAPRELLGVVASAIDPEVVLVSSGSKLYKTGMKLSAFLEDLEDALSVEDLDVEPLGEGETVDVDLYIGSKPPAQAGKPVLVTPPWTSPRMDYPLHVSWIVYGLGWASRLASTAGVEHGLEEALTGVADLWTYQLREKRLPPSDAAGAIALNTLELLFQDIYSSRTL